MKINASTMKMWSRIGSRATFGIAALELAKEAEKMMVVTGDVSTSAGLQRYKKQFPEKYLDVGIAEQNMMGIAAGLASEGFDVVTTTFAPFQTMRCCEQIKVNLGYMGHKVCMVGLASGVVLGPLGYTHCCIEDISVMRSIPGVTVVSPADCGETVKAAQAALSHHSSVYLRLTGGAGNPQVYTDDYDFEIGKAIELRTGSDVTFIAAGTMVRACLDAAQLMETRGVSAGVVNMHTIKPIDEEAIRKACSNSKLVVTVEEHSVIGGLGAAVAEYKATLANVPPQFMIGLPDAYGKTGDYQYMLEKYGLTAEQIANNTIEKLASYS